MTPLPSNIAELQDLVKRIQEDADAVRTEARDKLDARREKIRTQLSELHGIQAETPQGVQPGQGSGRVRRTPGQTGLHGDSLGEPGSEPGRSPGEPRMAAHGAWRRDTTPMKLRT